MAESQVPHVPSEYKFHINPEEYDRRVTLSDDELKLVRRWKEEHLIITRRQAPRLRTPLTDVLYRSNLDRANSHRALKYLLLEVARQEAPYWGWSEDLWIEIINNSPVLKKTGIVPQIIAVAYLLCGFRSLYKIQRNVATAVVARLVFGAEIVDTECERLFSALTRVGFVCQTVRPMVPSIFAAVALQGENPKLESFNREILEYTRECYAGNHVANRIGILSNGLAAMGLTSKVIHFRAYPPRHGTETDNINPEWMTWCRRWLETTTLREGSRRAVYNTLTRIGIWLSREHPEVTGPEQWTVSVCADYLAAVDKLHVGGWGGSTFDYRLIPTAGQPLQAPTKVAYYQVMRRFLSDIQSWEWARLRCNPRYHLATPRNIAKYLGVNPRTIDDAAWLKLTWASLNIEPDDLSPDCFYPFALLQAIAVVWTHAGLRSNEIARLRVGCTREQSEDVIDQSGNVVPAGQVCWLDVPEGKTSVAYTKPVSHAVHKYIAAWMKKRASPRKHLDRRTGEHVHFLFQLRNRPIAKEVLNQTVIPLLCKKAGIPLEDSKGRITSHRGRASAVSMLANVPQGMTIFDLAKWCGHTSVQSTMSYVRSKPTQLASAFAKADQAARMIEIVIDHEVIAAGATKDGAPWKYYDLGDSYCSNAFWSTCPHRMACARCYFNIPKPSAKGVVLTAQQAANRLLEEVWLSPEERDAVSGDVEALEGMLNKLRDKPTPDGRTPGEISATSGALASSPVSKSK
ncbi:site-specific integrase [Gluconobacter cerinus]|uniref:tyrosine-type recombinase/integrase n=1 Tax=Gluconobacter cerinus TaxID=38307 RepID=UPI00309C6460